MYEQRQKQKPNEVTSVIIEGHFNRFCYLLTYSLTYLYYSAYLRVFIFFPLYMWFNLVNKLHIKTANNIVKQTPRSLPTKAINQPKIEAYFKKYIATWNGGARWNTCPAVRALPLQLPPFIL